MASKEKQAPESEALQANYDKLYAEYTALREKVVEAKQALDAALIAERRQAVLDSVFGDQNADVEVRTFEQPVEGGED